MVSTLRKYDTAIKRWAGVGPYYAMFPSHFSDSVISRYTSAGDVVIDPFAGRATAIYSAASSGRVGIGVEVNPVGWVYGKAKLQPSPKEKVIEKIKYISAISFDYSDEADNLPEFFHKCYSKNIRCFLLAARDMLNWKKSSTDWTLAALLLIYLHGKRDSSLSNQMRQTKSLSPQYAINWWDERKMSPPEIDPVIFMDSRIKWRYEKGKPKNTTSHLYLGDCTEILPHIEKLIIKKTMTRPKLFITSPPYCGITNYYYDQWLRLWLLGYPPIASNNYGMHCGKFSNKDSYNNLLSTTFEYARRILDKNAVIYVRTDNREFTFTTTLNILSNTFPDKKTQIVKQPLKNPSQTKLFGDHRPKPGEIDIILTN